MSEKSAIVYLGEAEEAIKRASKYTAFMDKLCKIISDLKKINASDDTIIVKIQDEFHFTNDDAEFYYEYAMKKRTLLENQVKRRSLPKRMENGDMSI